MGGEPGIRFPGGIAKSLGGWVCYWVCSFLRSTIFEIVVLFLTVVSQSFRLTLRNVKGNNYIFRSQRKKFNFKTWQSFYFDLYVFKLLA